VVDEDVVAVVVVVVLIDEVVVVTGLTSWLELLVVVTFQSTQSVQLPVPLYAEIDG
jgi:hypothetical protein